MYLSWLNIHKALYISVNCAVSSSIRSDSPLLHAITSNEVEIDGHKKLWQIFSIAFFLSYFLSFYWAVLQHVLFFVVSFCFIQSDNKWGQNELISWGKQACWAQCICMAVNTASAVIACTVCSLSKTQMLSYNVVCLSGICILFCYFNTINLIKTNKLFISCIFLKP